MTIEADADTRRKEAADWFARLNQRKVSTDDVKGFSAWRRDPANAAAFDRVQAAWDASAALSRTPAMADLSQAARTRAHAARRPSDRLTGLIKPLGAAGAVALALGAAVLWQSRQPVVYQTEVGERRVVQLTDGSQLTLDTASRVAVRFSGDQRAVLLEAGQAQFDVERDPQRPFTVRAGGTEVTALGTRFDVRRFGEGARVVLVEGRVSVSDKARADRKWALVPGQQVTTSAARPQVMAANVPAATSWTAGRLTFDNLPIATAVAEVNRYTESPIELRDPDIGSVRVSGVFDAGDVDAFVAALRDLYPLEAQRAPDGHLVLTQRPAK